MNDENKWRQALLNIITEYISAEGHDIPGLDLVEGIIHPLSKEETDLLLAEAEILLAEEERRFGAH